MVEISMFPDLLPLPHLLPDGPQTGNQVLALHEHQRLKRLPDAFAFHNAQQLMQLCATILVYVCAGKHTPPLTPKAPSASNPCLVLLIASHIRSHARILTLRRCLAAVSNQVTGSLAAVLLSWSVSESVLRDGVIEMLGHVSIPQLRAFEQPEPLKQFEHYSFLARAAFDLFGPRAWVTFSDDDDLMHPCRRCRSTNMSHSPMKELAFVPAGAVLT